MNNKFSQFSIQELDQWLIILLSLIFCILITYLFYLLSKKEDIKISKDENAKPSNPVSLNHEIDELKDIDNLSIIEKFKKGLAKTRHKLTSSLEDIFKHKKNLDPASLEAIYEILYQSDIGVTTVDKLVSHLEETFVKEKECDLELLKKELCRKSLEIVNYKNESSNIKEQKPHVILVVGVNGAGKTTTIGKLAARYISQGKSVCICAGDTYRAAAIEQLQVWGKRLNTRVVAHKHGSDPAAVAYDSIKATLANQFDVLIIDTAGRLQNKTNLMNELSKINKIISREIPEAPHETLLVVDATTGQNAFSQVKSFKEFANISGIILTKLDGTAKGGVLIGIIDQFSLPVQYIGVGEKISDLRPFEPNFFIQNLFS